MSDTARDRNSGLACDFSSLVTAMIDRITKVPSDSQ